MRAFEAGFDMHFVKPIATDAIVGVLERMAESAGDGRMHEVGTGTPNG